MFTICRAEEVIIENKKRDQGKQQWLQDASQTNADNLNSVRHETSRHFTKKQGMFERLVNQLETSSRTRTLGNCVQTEEFRKGYQPRNNLAEEKNSDLLADLSNILSKWKNNLSVLQCTWC